MTEQPRETPSAALRLKLGDGFVVSNPLQVLKKFSFAGPALVYRRMEIYLILNFSGRLRCYLGGLLLRDWRIAIR